MASLVKYAHAASAAPSPRCTPERRLLIAVLEQAILDLTDSACDCADPQRRRDARRDRQDAVHWLFDERAHGHPLSLDWLCAQLDRDAGPLRQRLARRYRRDILAARREPVLDPPPRPLRMKELTYGHDTPR